MSEAGPSNQMIPIGAQAGQEKKRKRTGKEREERKQAAILAAEQEKPVEAAPAVIETGEETSDPLAGQGKKRKRTGKEREERKQAFLAVSRLGYDEKLQADMKAQKEKAEAGEEVEVTQEGEETGVVKPEADVGAEPEVAAAPEVDLDRLSKRLPTALKHLNPVFKRAKTTETQRLIKKIKALKSKGKDGEAESADMEAQRQLLAHLPVGPTLSRQLLTNLRKHRLFKRNPTIIPDSVVEILSMEPSATSGEVLKKVENRLCSSKAAADEMKRAVAWLMGEEGSKLGGPTKKAPATGKEIPVRPAKGNVKRLDEDAEDEEDVEISVGRNMVVNSEDEDEGDDEGEEVEADDAGWESGSISGDDDDEEDGDRPSRSRLANSFSGSDSDEDAIAIKPPTKKPKSKETTKSTKAEAQPSKKLTSSTFLPSLSTGFTRGGSDDSDPDDDFGEGLEDIIGKGKPGERKNRRGQRARQAIWERKYGKNAKHIKKAGEQATEGNIAKAYGSRAGAVSGAKPSTAPATGAPGQAPAATGSRPSFTPSARPAFTPSARPVQAAPATAPATAGLHPSWEAARLRKQREAEGPKATKIVFD